MKMIILIKLFHLFDFACKTTAANSPLKKAILLNVEVSAFFNFKAGLLSMAIFIA